MTQNSIGSANQILQIVSNQLTTVLDCSGTKTPADDTIPQNTEGVEVLTVSITPKFATSNLLITFSGIFSISTSDFMTIALFQDTTANALTSKCLNILTACGSTGFLQYSMVSGTTSSTTFKIRAGPAVQNLYCNGSDTGGQWMGGVAATVLTVEEYT
jgi:hypothetical protein